MQTPLYFIIIKEKMFVCCLGAHDVGFCVCPPQHLRQELELKFYEDRFDWDQVRQNDAAGLLKMFIRELPYPLLTQQHLPAFTAAQSESEHQYPRLFTGFISKVANLICA